MGAGEKSASDYEWFTMDLQYLGEEGEAGEVGEYFGEDGDIFGAKKE